MKSGNLNFLEYAGPLQACNGTALPLSVLGITGLFPFFNRYCQLFEFVVHDQVTHCLKLELTPRQHCSAEIKMPYRFGNLSWFYYLFS